MVDLIVTSIAVDEAARQLKLIHDELENAEDARRDRDDIWGHEVVRIAMRDFVHDWTVKREQLMGNIEDLQKKTEQAAETWGDAEVQLTNALKPEGQQ